MKKRRNRSKLFIATKVGFAYPGVKEGLTTHQIERECEKSLKRLGIETIDLYYAHVDDRYTNIEETLEAFNRLIKAGKIRFIGASNYLSWRLEEAHWISKINNWSEYCCIQQRYSYLRPNPGGLFTPQISANRDLLNYTQSRNITLLAYSPLLNGAYTQEDRSFPEQYSGSDMKGRLAELNAVSKELGVTINQVIYAWMMNNNPPIIPLMAASNTFHMQENLESLTLDLNEEYIERLNNSCTGGNAW
ncbi:MAG: Aldo/keto reductase [Candidatus Magnetoglobus multicellularis str. Araruama]|uniref:Aldo/keto reductase n=1 Tax=Candidatus Magnetoglobus multicellularis str. Araruama TaxID=890399 RepID=A0A1V1PB51_9BACT|nr:MAG: Aldo/keto reductase [Candidatus Magnetoglobus multicellularis str. Araruama]